MTWTPHPVLGIECDVVGAVLDDGRIAFIVDPSATDRLASVETIRAIPPYKPARAEKAVKLEN